jgi:hypothetical protein
MFDLRRAGSKYSFLLVGIWWGSVIWPSSTVTPAAPVIFNINSFEGYRELQKVWNQLKDLRLLKDF